jgi:hypothetical protein
MSSGVNPNTASHTSAMLGGATNYLNPPFSLKDGVIRTVTIRYTASTNQLAVYLEALAPLVATVNIPSLLGLSNGYAYVGFTSSTGGSASQHEILEWKMITAEDRTKADTIGVYRKPSQSGNGKGTFYLRNSNTSGFADYTAVLDFVTNDADIPVTGDWNGDGIDTVGVYTTTNIYKLINQNASASTAEITQALLFATVGDKPIVGDWNGDGIDTFAVFRNGWWYFSNNINSPSLTASTSFGISGDIPVAGDWDGDQVDTIGVFRPSTGFWYLTNTRITTTNQTSPTANYSFQYGLPDETGKPFTGKWNGRKSSGIGLYRSGTELLRLGTSQGSADMQFNFGIGGDSPVAGRWIAQEVLAKWYVDCGQTTGVNARSFPSLDGQVIIRVAAGTSLNGYEVRNDVQAPIPGTPPDILEPGQWVRVSNYGQYQGYTLWMRINTTFRSTGVTTINLTTSTPNPASCAVATLIPPVVFTLSPTPTAQFPSSAPGCVPGSYCPHVTPGASTVDQVAFVIACEADINAVNNYEAAVNVAHTILNRMKSGTYSGAVPIDIVSQSGQFQCWAEGARDVSNLGVQEVVPPFIKTMAANMQTNPTAVPTAIGVSIQRLSLYFIGDGAFAANATTPTILPFIIPCSTLPAVQVTKVYLGSDQLNPTNAYINSYFSANAQCQ